MRNELHTISEFNTLVERAIDFIQSPPPPSLSTPSTYTPVPLSEQQRLEVLEHVHYENLEQLKLDDRQSVFSVHRPRSPLILDGVGGRAIGYTLKCLGAGTWALRKALETPEDERAGLFERCITDITMQGGDADTNATVAGSLLGVYLTHTCIPQKWTGHLLCADWLVQKARYAVSIVDPSQGLPQYNWKEDKDVLIDGGRGAPTEEELRKRYDELMCEVGRRVHGGIELPGLGRGKKKDKDGHPYFSRLDTSYN
ncbi:hypothetical protein FRC06_007460 [Ceratobasidium sp. 370]|nr:hypothetical protein FRC06_007460 [Ceratobasidium sp. 370]